MVTTRSAERRIAEASKVHELVVRPKVSDLDLSPTPTATTTRTKAKITINVPPPLGERARSMHNDLDMIQDTNIIEDDSPYATAKESPESFRDVASHASGSILTSMSSPLRLTYASGTGKDQVLDYKSVYSAIEPPKRARISNFKAGSSAEDRAARAEDQAASTIDHPNMSRALSTKMDGSISRVTEERGIPPSSQSDSWMSSALDPVLNTHALQHQPIAIATSSKATSGHRSLSLSHSIPSSSQARSFANGLPTRITKRKTRSSRGAKEHSQPHINTNRSQLLPASARNSVESYRRKILDRRCLDRRKSFKLAAHWTSKKRKFTFCE